MDTGNTYYVNSTFGSDQGTGTEQDPWKSLQFAADQTAAGDTVYVAAGSYDPFEITTSGEPDSRITFSAYPGDEQEVMIDGTNSDTRGLIEIRAASYVTVSGFNLQNAPKDGVFVEGEEGEETRSVEILDNYIDTTGNSGIYVSGLVMRNVIPVDEYRMFDVLIEGNEVTNTNYPDGKNEAISIGGGVDGFVVRDNWVHDSDQYGIDAKTGAINGEISGNHIENIEKHGIYLDTGSRTVANIEVFDNLIEDCRNGIVLAREANKEPPEPELYNIDIYDNTITGMTNIGVMAYTHSYESTYGTLETGRFDDVQIFNNTIEDSGQWAISLRPPEDVADNFVVAANTFSGNGNGEIRGSIEYSVSVDDLDLRGLSGLETVTDDDPLLEEPVAEEPILEDPIVEEPAVEEPVVDDPEEPEPEAPVSEDPDLADPVEEPDLTDPVVEDPIVEEPVNDGAEEPVPEEPVLEEPDLADPVIEDPIVEEPPTEITDIKSKGGNGKPVRAVEEEDGNLIEKFFKVIKKLFGLEDDDADSTVAVSDSPDTSSSTEWDPTFDGMMVHTKALEEEQALLEEKEAEEEDRVLDDVLF